MRQTESMVYSPRSSLEVVLDDVTADTTTGLINQAVRQNIKGRLTQPLSQLQWAHIVMSSHGVSSADLSSGDA